MLQFVLSNKDSGAQRGSERATQGALDKFSGPLKVSQIIICQNILYIWIGRYLFRLFVLSLSLYLFLALFPFVALSQKRRDEEEEIEEKKPWIIL